MNRITFHFKGDVKGHVKLKVASLYHYDLKMLRKPPYKVGGDLIPNSSCNIQDIFDSYASLREPKLVTDGCWQYPKGFIKLNAPISLTHTPTIIDYINGIKEWIINNLVTTAIIIFILAIVACSIIKRR